MLVKLAADGLSDDVMPGDGGSSPCRRWELTLPSFGPCHPSWSFRMRVMSSSPRNIRSWTCSQIWMSRWISSVASSSSFPAWRSFWCGAIAARWLWRRRSRAEPNAGGNVCPAFPFSCVVGSLIFSLSPRPRLRAAVPQLGRSSIRSVMVFVGVG